MANFDFLLNYSEFSAFSGLANEAEKQYNNPTMFSVISARKCVEQAVHWMYSIDDELIMPYDDSIQVLVHDKNFVSIVPGNIQKDLQIVIKVGNQAVHSNAEVDQARALLPLKSLFNFTNWICLTYTDDLIINEESKICNFNDLILVNSQEQIYATSQDELERYKEMHRDWGGDN